MFNLEDNGPSCLHLLRQVWCCKGLPSKSQKSTSFYKDMNVLLVPVSSTLTAAYKTEMQLQQEKRPAPPLTNEEIIALGCYVFS